MPSHAVPPPHQSPERDRLVDLTMQASSVAHKAVSHAIDGLINGSQLALTAVRKCEEQLDNMDREMDEALAIVITQVAPPQAPAPPAGMKGRRDFGRAGGSGVG